MRKTYLLLTLLLLCVGISIHAQVTTASMSGKVTDTSSEAMIGVNIKATHTPTGTEYYTITQPNGSYSFNNLRIGGPYVVEFSYIGYNTESRTGINLVLGEDLKLNVVMREDTQALDEVVVVADKNPIISGSRTGAQEIITREKMDKLPTINRSLDDFVKLTPMSSGKNFGGVSYRFNNVTVDGASFNNSFGLASALGASGTEPISLEALEQVQVMIAPFDVRNGGFTGAGINSVTKSGSNEFHASVYMYTKSPSMMGYRVKDETIGVSEFSNHQYGISLSGPIIKNKLFFFINGEMDRQEEPISYTTAIPLSRGAIWLMANSISHVARPEEEGEWQYFASSKKIGWKTGTSYGNRDAWAVGMTPDYAVGVWVGNCTGEGRPLMTGVGYAAPVLFEVFGLLPIGEWFAEPVGDLEPAVVCRQSGYLASHICPDRDTVMIPRAAALGEVCPYHRIVNLSADLKYRVTADCYDPARIVRMPMFILPPAQEWYYRRQHPDYRPLPPLHPGLPGNQAENNPIDIIYPQPGRVLVAPRSLEGEQQSLVFTAVHRDRNAVLFWHIDDDYVGSTSFEHKVSVRPAPGKHRLTVIDEHGASQSVVFSCR